ncbi:helix-turn-helix transcriptional regulator [Cohnella herbarum]|uniref:Helix-turn-helix transcriptional regulator n=1 Tax=Cohnella herbarum TaxID=2728023 RepID=A0A7Z2ZP61_9BACL|nr:helix-turn-helix domain-containing protein [Cohnella herbarum]QJD86809.1 helix-turn-helix transcriptional regulator [Cohnella herbarum]
MSDLYFTAPPLPYYIFSGESIFKPGECHPARSNIGLFDLLVVSKGTLYIGEENQSWAISDGQALILRPDKSHYSTKAVESETRFYWLHFNTSANWSDLAPAANDSMHQDNEDRYRIEQGLVTRPFSFSLPQYMALKNPESVYGIIRELIQLEQQPRSWARWQHQIHTQNLLKTLAGEHDVFLQSSALQLAERVAIFLRKNYRSSFTNEILQREFNFHPVYIARCMKKAFGCSPLEYLARYRIEQSKLLMINTSLPIERIATEVGFHHQTYFSHTFRKLENMAPSVFRKTYIR